MNSTKKTVGEKLKKIAKKQGESSYSVSDATGISRPTVKSIFNGESNDPGFKKVVKIADFLGKDLEELT